MDKTIVLEKKFQFLAISSERETQFFNHLKQMHIINLWNSVLNLGVHTQNKFKIHLF